MSVKSPAYSPRIFYTSNDIIISNYARRRRYETDRRMVKGYPEG